MLHRESIGPPQRSTPAPVGFESRKVAVSKTMCLACRAAQAGPLSSAKGLDCGKLYKEISPSIFQCRGWKKGLSKEYLACEYLIYIAKLSPHSSLHYIQHGFFLLVIIHEYSVLYTGGHIVCLLSADGLTRNLVGHPRLKLVRSTDEGSTFSFAVHFLR